MVIIIFTLLRIVFCACYLQCLCVCHGVLVTVARQWPGEVNAVIMICILQMKKLRSKKDT